MTIMNILSLHTFTRTTVCVAANSSAERGWIWIDSDKLCQTSESEFKLQSELGGMCPPLYVFVLVAITDA